MTSIGGPAIDIEIDYRRERVAEDFRRTRRLTDDRPARTDREGWPTLAARAA